MDSLCADSGAFPTRQSNARLLLAESVHDTGKSLCSTAGSDSGAGWLGTADLRALFDLKGPQRILS